MIDRAHGWTPHYVDSPRDDVAANLCPSCSPHEAGAVVDMVAPCGHVDPLGHLTGTACRSCADRGAREVTRT